MIVHCANFLTFTVQEMAEQLKTSQWRLQTLNAQKGFIFTSSKYILLELSKMESCNFVYLA